LLDGASRSKTTRGLEKGRKRKRQLPAGSSLPGNGGGKRIKNSEVQLFGSSEKRKRKEEKRTEIVDSSYRGFVKVWGRPGIN